MHINQRRKINFIRSTRDNHFVLNKTRDVFFFTYNMLKSIKAKL
jgi:hypothetical protein